MYTEEDFLIAKLKGEILPRYKQDFHEQVLLTGEVRLIEGFRQRLPDYTCEEWLAEKNAHWNFTSAGIDR